MHHSQRAPWKDASTVLPPPPLAVFSSPAEGNRTPDSQWRVFTQSLRVCVSAPASRDTSSFSFFHFIPVATQSARSFRPFAGQAVGAWQARPHFLGNPCLALQESTGTWHCDSAGIILQNSLLNGSFKSSWRRPGSAFNPRVTHRCLFLGPDWGCVADL